MENGGEFDLSDADNTDEKISILAQRSAHNIRAGQHEQGIAELKEMLDRYCEDNDVSMSDTIRRALKQFLQDINK